MARIKKLTPDVLRKLVVQEALSGELEPVENVEAEEVEASDQAQALEKHIDHAKVLKLEEERVIKRLRKIQEARRRVHKKILRGL
jgi:hypothetical protein